MIKKRAALLRQNLGVHQDQHTEAEEQGGVGEKLNLKLASHLGHV